MEVVAGQPIKKLKYFRIPQSLYWRPSADQKARGLWVRPSADQKARGLWVRDCWGTGIQLPQDFCGKTMEAVAGQPIKKFNFFQNSPESLLAPTR